MDEYTSDSLKMSKVRKSMDTSHNEEMEKLASEMIAYLKVKNNPSLMLHVFNEIRSKLKITGIVKIKDGKIFIEKQ